jgi:hypothetical protein
VARVTILGALLAMLAATAHAAPADSWAPLYRPLHLPTLAPGAPCPVAKPAGGAFKRYGIARGLGPGPAYPIGATVRFPQIAGETWGKVKVLWFVAPRYRGHVLIRGHRLDGDAEVRFDATGAPSLVTPPDELRIPAGWRAVRVPGIKAVGQRYMPSSTRLRESGCYAYQVDGTTFSRVVVFRAVAVPE